MPCKVVDLGNGRTAIIRFAKTRQKPCVVCNRPGEKLCDFPLTGSKAGKTCDRSLCARHAVHTDPDTDHCPTHAEMVQHSGLFL